MTRPADAASAPAPTSGLLPALGVIGLACLAVITLASPGATRMFAWPWSLAYLGALLAPALALLTHAFAPSRPFVLPSPAWRFTALAAVASVLLSALLSPYRGPSLLWSAPLLAALAFFFVAHDALRHPSCRAPRLATVVGLFFAAIVLTSIALWLPSVPGRSLALVAEGRNGYPLGHSNYTAGLALLALPWFAALAWRNRGPVRLAWTLVAAHAFVMFLSSGSRAGMAGLAVLGFTALLLAPFPRRKKFTLTAALAVAGLALVLAHPRTRSLLAPADPAAPPNISNVQRAAMLTAATRMGADRPLLGWGPGTTPLVYPLYRAGLAGGAENVLQLHSTPAQLWAEFGAAGLACALLAVLLLLRALVSFPPAPRPPAPPPPASPAPLLPLISHLLNDNHSELPDNPTAIRHLMDYNDLVACAGVALAGYAVFAVGDWQLDVPVFGFAVALCAALLAAAPTLAPPAATPRAGRVLGIATLLVIAVLVLAGRPDPTPALNVRALALARDPTRAPAAVALLRESLALNPDQEIAHFNLGWLLLISDPLDAERHFIEAIHLVPDKGGVYFGLGLARLNQNHPALAARAFALECLNDPAFLSSPWWREPAIAAVLPVTRAEFAHLASLAGTALKKTAHPTWAAAQLPRVAALAPRLGEVPAGPERSYRRERTAYPVLARNLDLPPPLDLYDVREPTPSSASPPSSASSASSASSPLPAKSWLPSSLLLELLDAPVEPTLSHYA